MDNFSLLGQPRRPWIDPESLKAVFLEISACAHPDRVHGGTDEERSTATGRYAELNSAYNCLREPKQRLLHLLELELGAPPPNVQDIPSGTMELFVEVGKTCREADSLLAAKPKTASPLLQAQWFEKGMECSERLSALQRQIQLRADELLAELRGMNSVWNDAPAPESPARADALPLRRLEEISREFSYISRWSGQIHERIAQLSF
jgi:DnaJ-domain-containing protein 1